MNIQAKISVLKRSYQEQYQELKELKSEIDRIQNLLEKSRVQLQNDFEKWLAVMLRQKQDQMKSSATGGGMAGTSTAGFSGGATDKRVSENLEAFYRARNEIYK